MLAKTHSESSPLDIYSNFQLFHVLKNPDFDLPSLFLLGLDSNWKFRRKTSARFRSVLWIVQSLVCECGRRNSSLRENQGVSRDIARVELELHLGVALDIATLTLSLLADELYHDSFPGSRCPSKQTTSANQFKKSLFILPIIKIYTSTLVPHILRYNMKLLTDSDLSPSHSPSLLWRVEIEKKTSHRITCDTSSGLMPTSLLACWRRQRNFHVRHENTDWTTRLVLHKLCSDMKLFASAIFMLYTNCLLSGQVNHDEKKSGIMDQDRLSHAIGTGKKNVSPRSRMLSNLIFIPYYKQKADIYTKATIDCTLTPKGTFRASRPIPNVVSHLSTQHSR